MSLYSRPTYVLSHAGATLLVLDAELSPPFTIGERVEIFNATTGTSDGWFVVRGMQRGVLYHTAQVSGYRVPLAGQEVVVELERLNNTEE